MPITFRHSLKILQYQSFFCEIGIADESAIRNINKYLESYSGGKFELREEDIFTLVVPIKKQTNNGDITTHQDAHQDTPHEESVEDTNFEKVSKKVILFTGKMSYSTLLAYF